MTPLKAPIEPRTWPAWSNVRTRLRRPRPPLIYRAPSAAVLKLASSTPIMTVTLRLWPPSSRYRLPQQPLNRLGVASKSSLNTWPQL